MKFFTSLLLSMCITCMVVAQGSIADIAMQHLTDIHEDLSLTSQDVQEVIVDYAYTDQNGNSFVYLVQTHEGVPVYNAIVTVAIKSDGTIASIANRFVSDLAKKISSTEATMTPSDAVAKVARHLQSDTEVTHLRSDDESGVQYFIAPELAASDIPVQYVYEVDGDGQFHKAYDLAIDMKENADYWSIRLDAKSGAILSQTNWTVYCNHDHMAYHKDHSCRMQFAAQTEQRQAVIGDGASYRVYAFPTESPIHGDQVLLVDPADQDASPLGWHDTNGMEGADYTITRGNNVWAYIDSTSTNSSQGTEPDGGDDLVFDIPHDPSNEPAVNGQSAQINLFYANNYMHDLTYRLGFDESAGNFQTNNYSGQGIEGDFVRAEALDGSGVNNANFSTPPDGGNGRMQMYVWNNPSGVFSIDAPEQIAGFITEVGPADWGQPIDSDPVTGEVAFVDDGTQFPQQGCFTVQNTDEVNGKVAFVDRGTCEFGTKALNAENAGAIGVVICNIAGVNGGNGEELLNLGAGDDGGQVTIPVLMLKKSDCDRVRASLSGGIDVTVTFQSRGPNGPNQLDGSFDNGVIAHEYGHGISNRLTGGPNNSGCFPTFDDDDDGTADRGEQMGEGWSDYFALITTLEGFDTGADQRGIGNYADGSTVNGRGIRRFPYSTDMSICPLTYDDIRTGSVPHGVGEVWAAVLWDLTWAMIDAYGMDPTWQDPQSGNWRAARLVMDGMKIQPCQPGYVDGRDAILAADEINYDGENACLIWNVFARRGLGINADQGSSLDQRDGTQDFSPLATCVEKLKIDKQIADLVQPGATLTVDITATNHVPGDAVEVFVTDKLPEGLTYVEDSSPYPATVNDNEVVFALGEMNYLDIIPFSYEVESSTSIQSTTLALQNFEDGGNEFDFITTEGVAFWLENNDYVNSGNSSYAAAAADTETDFSLVSPTFQIPDDVELPALRFWHRYDLEVGADGGFLSISTDDGNTWIYIRDFIKNGYDGEIQYTTFAIPALDAFNGSTNGAFIDSYVDLSDYKGQDVKFRWRLGTDDNTTVAADFAGWIIDDVEIMDLSTYEVETCIGTMENMEIECNPANVIIIDSELDTDTDDIDQDIYEMNLYPNPAQTKIYVDVVAPVQQVATVQLTDLTGKVLFSNDIALSTKSSTHGFNIVDLTSGMYLIQVQSDAGLSTRKFVKQ